MMMSLNTPCSPLPPSSSAARPRPPGWAGRGRGRWGWRWRRRQATAGWCRRSRPGWGSRSCNRRCACSSWSPILRAGGGGGLLHKVRTLLQWDLEAGEGELIIITTDPPTWAHMPVIHLISRLVVACTVRIFRAVCCIFLNWCPTFKGKKLWQGPSACLVYVYSLSLGKKTLPTIKDKLW